MKPSPAISLQKKITPAGINECLQHLCRTLGEKSLNYTINIQLYLSLGMATKSLKESVCVALGNGFVIGGAKFSTSSDLVESLRSALNYSGDYGSHPNRAILSSTKFKAKKEEVLADLCVFLDGAERIVLCWLKAGHPFCPVFWEFAYMIEKGNDANVFIGSNFD